jgi:hypothetical protein
MTFCIAWKTQKESYIISDEIVSTAPGFICENNSTVFGESLGGDIVGSRHDGIIKSHFGENYIASLVGDVDKGFAYFDFLVRCVDDYELPILESIDRTLKNFGSGYSSSGFEIVISSYFDDASRLYVVRPGDFCELDEGIYFFGNPTSDFKDYVAEFYKGFIFDYSGEVNFPEVDKVFFVKTLTSIQFYGIHNYTISWGAGGCYVGGWCNSSGVSRQPPILYLISGENPVYQLKRMVGVIPNGDFVGMVPDCDERLRVLTPFNRIGNLSYDQAVVIAKNCVDVHDSAGYEFVVLLNVVRKSMVIVWTRKELFHTDFIFDLTRSGEGDSGMILSQRLLYMLNRLYDSDEDGTCCAFLPYQPASIQQVKEFNEQRLDYYLTMGFYAVRFGYRCIVSSDPHRCIFLSEAMIVPFLSDFLGKNKDFIIVDSASGLVAVRVENGEVIFPENLSEAKLMPILKGVGCNFFYLFEFFDPEDEGFNTREVVVAAESYDKAVESATAKVSRIWSNFDTDLIYIGEIYYHAIVASMMAFGSNEGRINKNDEDGFKS